MKETTSHKMTVAECIERLGGTAAMAKAFGVSPPAVSNWRADNWFPWQRHSTIRAMCAAQGVDFDPEHPAATQEGEAA